MHRKTRRSRAPRLLLAGAGLCVAGVALADPLAQRLDPVVVLAHPQDAPEQQVPASLSVLDGETLESQRLTSVGQLSRRVANLQLGDLNGVRAVYLRGVGGGGRQVGFEPRAGLYVDGVLLSTPPSANALLLDLDRVEVIRGPQGSLFGQNTVSGAISLITREPGEDTALQVRAGYGDGGYGRLAAALDAPLAGPALRMRASLSLAGRQGYTVNQVDGRELDQNREAAGRLRLRWQPDPELRLDLAGDLALQASQMPTGESLSGTFGTGPALPPALFQVALNTPQTDQNRNGGLAATLHWTPGPVELTSISAYRYAVRHWRVDLDYSPRDYNLIDYTDRYPRLSQELRLRRDWPGLGLDGLLGLYYYDQRPHSERQLLALSEIGAVVPALAPGDFVDLYPEVHTRSLALFGTLGYRLAADWRLDAGVRATWLAQRLRYRSEVSGGYQSLGVSAIPQALDRDEALSLSPDLALSYRPWSQARLYLRYARGVKDGGYDVDTQFAPRTQPARFEAETVDSLELGFKSDWLARRLRANAALFVSEYRDFQVSQFQPNGSFVVPVMANAGKVRIWGPELELSGSGWQGFGGRLSAAWLHAEYREFKDGGGAGVDFSGRRSEFAPAWSGSASVDYRQRLPRAWLALDTLGAALHYDWRSSFFTQPSNLPSFRADARSLLGLQLSLADAAQRVELALYADNLLNERYLESLNRGTLGTFYGRQGDPRRIGMQLSANF